jgi:hypothetical protein
VPAKFDAKLVFMLFLYWLRSSFGFKLLLDGFCCIDDIANATAAAADAAADAAVVAE